MGEIWIGNGGGEDMNQPDVSAENKVRSGQRGEPCRGAVGNEARTRKEAHEGTMHLCRALRFPKHSLCSVG